MVDACVYTWAFSLWSVQAFGDASDLKGMPTFRAYICEQRQRL
nr:MAG TPA: hypothetical protein [Caudoviricetes sp.]